MAALAQWVFGMVKNGERGIDLSAYKATTTLPSGIKLPAQGVSLDQLQRIANSPEGRAELLEAQFMVDASERVYKEKGGKGAITDSVPVPGKQAGFRFRQEFNLPIETTETVKGKGKKSKESKETTEKETVTEIPAVSGAV